MAFKKIHPRYTTVVTAGIMALIMSGIISLVLTLVNGHFAVVALTVWPLQWLKSFIIGWPVATLILPRVRQLALALVASETGVTQ